MMMQLPVVLNSNTTALVVGSGPTSNNLCPDIYEHFDLILGLNNSPRLESAKNLFFDVVFISDKSFFVNNDPIEYVKDIKDRVGLFVLSNTVKIPLEELVNAPVIRVRYIPVDLKWSWQIKLYPFLFFRSKSVFFDLALPFLIYKRVKRIVTIGVDFSYFEVSKANLYAEGAGVGYGPSDSEYSYVKRINFLKSLFASVLKSKDIKYGPYDEK